MNTPNSRVRFRYQDYKGLPESMDRRYELMDGALYMVPAPTTTHQRISRNLEFLLQQYCKGQDWGEVLYAPVDLVLGSADERDVVQPDLLLVRNERLSIITEEEVRGAPDLVVEILSPGTEQRDRGYKRVLYGRHGVLEYWIVDPTQGCIEIYALTDSGLDLMSSYQGERPLVSQLLPGFGFPAKEIFP